MGSKSAVVFITLVAVASLLSTCAVDPGSPSDGVADPTAKRAAPSPAPAPTPAPKPAPAPAGPADVPWTPSVGATWQWQLQGTLDTSVNASVFDVDLEDTTKTQVAGLHANGAHVICYMSVGTWEPWRSDADLLPATVRGSAVSGFESERWLDVRRQDLILPVIASRLDECKAKGFDAVEPDNVDGYTNSTGFPLTSADQRAFNLAIAEMAHDRGLSVALKNDLNQVAELEPYFDFAVNEQCFQYNECDMLKPFITAGKPVFHVEYSLDTSAFCGQAKALGFSSMRKRVDLDAWRQPC